MSVFNKIRCTLSGKSQVSGQVQLKVNYCLNYFHALFQRIFTMRLPNGKKICIYILRSFLIKIKCE